MGTRPEEAGDAAVGDQEGLSGHDGPGGGPVGEVPPTAPGGEAAPFRAEVAGRAAADGRPALPAVLEDLVHLGAEGHTDPIEDHRRTVRVADRPVEPPAAGLVP